MAVDDVAAAPDDQPEQPSAPAGAAEADDAAPLRQVAELTERLLRARADYDNLQKRVVREAAQERDRVRARVLERFLPVFEYARMAQAAAAATPGPLADGVRMVVAEFERLLADEGVVPLGQPGEPFDATRHEAVDEEEGDAGTVVRVVSPGYLLGERVLRYARVTVGREEE